MNRSVRGEDYFGGGTGKKAKAFDLSVGITVSDQALQYKRKRSLRCREADVAGSVAWDCRELVGSAGRTSAFSTEMCTCPRDNLASGPWNSSRTAMGVGRYGIASYSQLYCSHFTASKCHIIVVRGRVGASVLCE